MIKNKDSFNVIYDDNDFMAILHEAPAFLGHTLLITKNHYRILEELPDEIVSKIFNIANKISNALFESLNITGTNILVNNGLEAGQTHPHLIINIIPRTETDNINLDWPMHQADFAKIESTYKFLKDFVEKSILGDTDKIKKIEDSEDEIIKSSEEDYMIKQLKRIP